MSPVYCYRRRDNNELVEMFMTVSEKERMEDGAGQILVDPGVFAVRDYEAEFAPERESGSESQKSLGGFHRYEYEKVCGGEIVSLLMTVDEMHTLEESEDEDGCISLPDGALARRIIRGVNTRPPGNYPFYCAASGVSPEQIPDQQAELAKHGLKCEFNEDGDPKYESPEHRKRCLEAMGLYDRNGGYSDPRHGMGSRLEEELTPEDEY